jgi:hypothetical protein
LPQAVSTYNLVSKRANLRVRLGNVGQEHSVLPAHPVNRYGGIDRVAVQLAMSRIPALASTITDFYFAPKLITLHPKGVRRAMIARACQGWGLVIWTACCMLLASCGSDATQPVKRDAL